MKEKNGTKKATAATEQPTNVKPMEAVEASNAQAGADMAEASTDNAGGGEAPSEPEDGKGIEAVTVIIIGTDPYRAAIQAASVKKNLKGVDCDVHVVSDEHLRDTPAETLLEHLPHCHTERIVLMTDGMIILNPVTLGDIACIKAKYVGRLGILDYNQRMPVMMHKSVLEELLPSLIKDMPHADLLNAYFGNVYPEVRPVDPCDWPKSVWLLPLSSDAPDMAAVLKYAETQKFMYISSRSWSDDVAGFVAERFKDEIL